MRNWLYLGTILVSLLIAGCSRPDTYTVRGTVQTPHGEGIQGVTLYLEGTGLVSTDETGTFTIQGVTGMTSVTATKVGWDFIPASRTANQTQTTLTFIGRPNYGGAYSLADKDIRDIRVHEDQPLTNRLSYPAVSLLGWSRKANQLIYTYAANRMDNRHMATYQMITGSIQTLKLPIVDRLSLHPDGSLLITNNLVYQFITGQLLWINRDRWQEVYELPLRTVASSWIDRETILIYMNDNSVWEIHLPTKRSNKLMDGPPASIRPADGVGISPSGNYIFVIGDSFGTERDLFVGHLASNRWERVAHIDQGYAQFSPSEDILLLINKHNQLQAYDAATNQLTTLARATHFQWSPAGEIAAISDAHNLLGRYEVSTVALVNPSSKHIKDLAKGYDPIWLDEHTLAYLALEQQDSVEHGTWYLPSLQLLRLE